MKKDKRFAKAVFLLAEIYLFGGHYKNGNIIKYIEKYSILENSLIKLTDMYDCRNNYCVNTFMDEIYVFGGRYKGSFLDSSLEFHPN